MFKMENACEAAVEPEDPGQPSTGPTEQRGRPAGQRLRQPGCLLGLLAGAVGAGWGGLVGGVTGLAGAACAATFSLVTENISTLDVAAGSLGSVVGGTVGGLFCGAVGGAAGAAAARRFERSGCFRLASDLALGCATGATIGCSFHRTVGTIGGATGAAFGALAARELATYLTVSVTDVCQKTDDAGSSALVNPELRA